MKNYNTIINKIINKLNPNNWHHIAIIWTDEIKVYVNGQLFSI